MHAPRHKCWPLLLDVLWAFSCVPNADGFMFSSKSKAIPSSTFRMAFLAWGHEEALTSCGSSLTSQRLVFMQQTPRVRQRSRRLAWRAGSHRTHNNVAQPHQHETDFVLRLHDGAGQLTFAVRTAEPLVANCFVIHSSQLFDIRQDFLYSLHDGVHVLRGAKKVLMRKPHCFVIRGTIRFWTSMHVHIPQIEESFPTPTQGWKIGRIQWEERAFVDRLLKEPVTRNGLGLQRSNKLRARNSLCLILKIFEHVPVGSLLRNSWFGFQEPDARRILHSPFEMLHVFLTECRLLRQAFQLRA